MKQSFVLSICVIAACVTLSLGLSPFHAPRNTVTWMEHANGVAFGRAGTMSTLGPLEPASSRKDPGGSIEMWIEPDTWDSATLVSLYRPEKGLIVKLRQQYQGLELTVETKGERGQTTTAHFRVDEVLHPALQQKRSAFLTITAGPLGTTVYLNGALYTFMAHFWIPQEAFNGRLIVGDSPGQPDSFRGRVRGLAIYDAALSGEEVSRHYQGWVQRGRPEVSEGERNRELYLFNEKTGNTVHNQSGPYGDLRIPMRYTVVDKISLEPFWREFEFTRSYWRGNIKNIIGFIPLGACLWLYFMPGRSRRAAILLTLIGGLLVSLTIEVGQAFLPNRDSGTTDIITNTFGAWIGALCGERIYPALVERFKLDRWFKPVQKSLKIGLD